MAIITGIGLNVAMVAQLALHSEKEVLTLKISCSECLSCPSPDALKFNKNSNILANLFT